jgi:phosphoribosylamine--glycine ligase
VTGTGSTLEVALEKAYRGLQGIEFQGMHFRRDIGAKALRRKK